jgi:hypothetical protein
MPQFLNRQISERVHAGIHAGHHRRSGKDAGAEAIRSKYGRDGDEISIEQQAHDIIRRLKRVHADDVRAAVQAMDQWVREKEQGMERGELRALIKEVLREMYGEGGEDGEPGANEVPTSRSDVEGKQGWGGDRRRRLGRDEPPPFQGRPRPGGEIDWHHPDTIDAEDRRQRAMDRRAMAHDAQNAANRAAVNTAETFKAYPSMARIGLGARIIH